MKKANRHTMGFLPVSLTMVLSVLGCDGCSSSPARRELPFERSTQVMEFDSLWEETFSGPVTDIALAKKSGDVAVATIPDPDVGGKHLLTLISKKGKKRFQIQSPFPVKSLDIVEDGSLIVVSNYEGKLLAFDSDGKVVWDAEGGCKPMIINRSKRIVCYHDDDTKPSFAFDLFDFSGKRLARFPIKSDVLSIKASDDERWLGVALAGGRALVFDTTFSMEQLRPEKEQKVGGEILDLSLSNGDEPRLAVISLDVKRGQTLSVFDAKKSLIAALPLSYHVEQAEIFPAGKLITVYGNSPRGQYIAVHSAQDATLQWQKVESRYADYSLAVQVGEDRIIAGFEQIGEGSSNVKSRSSRLVVLDLDGKMRAELPLKTAEGAYIYSFAYAQERSWLAVGTDDKRLQLFELK